MKLIKLRSHENLYYSKKRLPTFDKPYICSLGALSRKYTSYIRGHLKTTVLVQSPSPTVLERFEIREAIQRQIKPTKKGLWDEILRLFR